MGGKKGLRARLGPVFQRDDGNKGARGDGGNRV